MTGQRGAAILTALLALLLLAALGGVAVLALRPVPSGDQRVRAARRAAEAGTAMAIDRIACRDGRLSTVGAAPSPGDEALPRPSPIAGADASALDATLGVSFSVTLASDPVSPPGTVLVRSVGMAHGARVTIEARLEPTPTCAIRVIGWRERP